MSNWEGGVRANAFVAGGFLPPPARGSKFEGLIAGWDWYLLRLISTRTCTLGKLELTMIYHIIYIYQYI